MQERVTRMLRVTSNSIWENRGERMIETRSICLGYRGRQVLAFIQIEVERTGRSPSYAMIAAELGISTISDVSHIVRRLEKRGLLKRSDTGSRYRRGWHVPVVELA